ncbi:DUF2642 domain-containing protein [Geomicrobium halophilum]|nr:DUF2642 domain-containing protein [Geomicrobium halophilum]
MYDSNYTKQEYERSMKYQPSMKVHPVDQPAFVNQNQVLYSPIFPVPAVPQPTFYVTSLDPVFVDHLSRHTDMEIMVETTSGKVVEGLLTAVAVDHIQININEDRAIHLRISEIVFFEGFPIG